MIDMFKNAVAIYVILPLMQLLLIGDEVKKPCGCDPCDYPECGCQHMWPKERSAADDGLCHAYDENCTHPDCRCGERHSGKT